MELLIYLFLLVNINIIIIQAKPDLLIEPQPAHNGDIIDFTCKYSDKDVTFLLVMGQEKNNILLTWQQGKFIVGEQFKINDKVTPVNESQPGILKFKMNATLCDEQKYICRVYSGGNSEDSKENKLEFIKPQVKTQLKEENNTGYIIIEELNPEQTFDFDCNFDYVRNASGVLISSENTNLIINKTKTEINDNHGTCTSKGSSSVKLGFKNYGKYEIKCIVNTTSNVQHLSVYEVDVISQLACHRRLSCIIPVIVGVIVLLIILVLILKFMITKRNLSKNKL